MAKPQRTPVERFHAKVIQTDSGCWLWNGGHTKRGYPVFRIGSLLDGSRRQIGAHVFACELKYGPLAPGQETHHVCRTRGCVNPDHLRPVDAEAHNHEHRTERVENGKRAAQRPAFRATFGRRDRDKTRCRNGHPYDDANTYRNAGERGCRICRKAAGIRRRLRCGQNVTAEIRAWLLEYEQATAKHRSARK